jgi:hypothetical protein
MELLEKLKDDREKEIAKTDLEKAIEKLSNYKPFRSNPQPNWISQPIWINPYHTDTYTDINWQQPYNTTPFSTLTNTSNGSTALNTLNSVNNISTLNVTNGSTALNTLNSVNNTTTTLNISNGSNVLHTSNDVNGKIEFIKSDVIPNQEDIIIDKEMEFDDDHLSMIMYEILPDLVKPLTVKDINTKIKEKDKIQKLLDLKLLLDNDLITKEEFNVLKKDII